MTWFFLKYHRLVRKRSRSLQKESKPLTPRPRARFADDERTMSSSPPPPDVIPVKTNSKEQGQKTMRL